MKPFIRKAELLTAFRTVYPDIIGAYEKIRFSTKIYPNHSFVWRTSTRAITCHRKWRSICYLFKRRINDRHLFRSKEVRGRLVDGFAVGKTVLNMFSYTGVFQ